MKCGKCDYKTGTEIPDTSSVAEKLQLLTFHREDSHPPPPQNVVGSPPSEDTRRKAKFPQPEIDQGQPLEVWETFLTQCEEFKRQVHIPTDKVPGQLVSCGSKELQTSLHRITGGTLYSKTEKELLAEMKKLVVRYQNPAVFVEEFLTIKQEGEESIRHYLSRLKGISNRCEFFVNCTCCAQGDITCCDAKVSYADNIT